jgi:hypothetical protein
MKAPVHIRRKLALWVRSVETIGVEARSPATTMSRSKAIGRDSGRFASAVSGGPSMRY